MHSFVSSHVVSCWETLNLESQRHAADSPRVRKHTTDYIVIVQNTQHEVNLYAHFETPHRAIFKYAHMQQFYPTYPVLYIFLLIQQQIYQHESILSFYIVS